MGEIDPLLASRATIAWLMTRSAHTASATEVRTALAARLRERLPELQGAVSTRVYSISDPRNVADPSYLQGLNGAMAAVIEYRLAVLEAGERQAPPIPTALLAHARLDARDNVSLDTVLRRYFAGNVLFGDLLVNEAERAEVPSSALRQLLAALGRDLPEGVIITVGEPGEGLGGWRFSHQQAKAGAADHRAPRRAGGPLCRRRPAGGDRRRRPDRHLATPALPSAAGARPRRR